MHELLDRLLRRLIRTGNLTLSDAQGRPHRYGDGAGPAVQARIADRRLEWRLLIDPYLALGEGYMSGRLRVERGQIYDLLALLASNTERQPLPSWTTGLDRLRFVMRRIMQFNPAPRARRNVAHHYDIDGAIYDLFLDHDRQYSCAYFANGEDLDEAQLAKKRHVAAKLSLEPGQRVLDIGCGWGGLGIYLALHSGANVTGVTLSRAQIAIANQRAASQGLQRGVRFEFKDYREVEGRFDRIVSVGMFEHVGVNHYASYFRKLHHLLTEDGIALVHTIGRLGQPTATDPFIAKYIFPGGYAPALSEMLPSIERSGLVLADLEVLRLHYAKTLRAWRERFLANWERAAALSSERFCRMWEFYLAGSETAFRHQGLVVFQLQLVKRADAVPLTRDYIADAEQWLLQQERAAAAQAPELAQQIHRHNCNGHTPPIA